MTEIYNPDARPAKQVESVQKEVQQAARKETAPRGVRRYRTWIFQIYVLIAILFFSLLAVFASTSAYFPIDLTITRFVQSYHPTWFNLLMEAISWFGYSIQATVILILLIITLYVSGFRWEAVMAALAGVGTELLNTLIKIVIHRPRPGETLVHVFAVISGYSFPSGHVMFYTGFYGFLLFLTFTLFKPSWRRTLAMIFLIILIAFIGVSRIYLGEHWASDVLGAYLVGSLTLAASVLIYRWGKTRFFVHQPVAKETPSK